ncbi:MAG: peptide deformylase [Terriglobia bacterium]|jgi:peptide deformylase|nr:peptide deformylase [Terriglobia bacterium]
MRLTIVQAGEKVLRETARPLTKEEILGDEIQRLIADMRDTMRDAPGVGLAAPQVGIPLQLAVIEDREEYQRDSRPEQIAERERRPVPFHVIVNPTITPAIDTRAEFQEGCLSVAGFVAVVPRWRQVRVECLNERGEPRIIEASGWYARILQHEIDHLQGMLYVDRMLSRTFMTTDNYAQHWKNKTIDEIRSDLRAN